MSKSIIVFPNYLLKIYTFSSKNPDERWFKHENRLWPREICFSECLGAPTAWSQSASWRIEPSGREPRVSSATGAGEHPVLKNKTLDGITVGYNFKTRAASSGSTIVTSIPVPTSNPAEMLILGSASMCQ